MSISLDRDDLATVKKAAKASYDGNLSAVFAEAARLMRQREARTELIEMLGGSTLTAESRAAIDAEQEGGPRYQPKKKPRRRKAA